MNGKYIVDEIKSKIKMSELIRFYGFEMKNNRIRCCFHNGSDFNCGIKPNYIHCFVCGESADAIQFVKRYFDLNFYEAVQKLNLDFNLGLPIGQKLDRRKRVDLAKKAFESRKAREQKEQEENALKNNYQEALIEYIRLEINQRKYKPKSQDETLHPLFVEAILDLPYAEHKLDCAEMELYQYERRSNYNT